MTANAARNIFVISSNFYFILYYFNPLWLDSWQRVRIVPVLQKSIAFCKFLRVHGVNANSMNCMDVYMLCKVYNWFGSSYWFWSCMGRLFLARWAWLNLGFISPLLYKPLQTSHSWMFIIATYCCALLLSLKIVVIMNIYFLRRCHSKLSGMRNMGFICCTSYMFTLLHFI